MTLPAVIFDMDGLLLDTEQVCLSCFVDTRRHFSLSDSPETFLKCVGLRGPKSRQIIIESLGPDVDFDAFDAEWDQRIDAALDHTIPIKEGAAELLQMLTEQGNPLAVATSTETERASRQLDAVGLLAHFEFVIGGDMVTKHKPDPEVYLTAAARLGYAPKDCVAFEDSETGTRAAITSGARTVQVPDLIAPSDEYRAMGHVIAPSLIEGAIAVGLIQQP
ncbi:MAG: HAD family phosphatase [Yoonia sp.]